LGKKLGLLDRPYPMLPFLHVGGLHEDFVILYGEMGVKQGNSEPRELAVLGQYASDLFQTGCIGVADGAYVSDMLQRIPLHGLYD
jgi:hypothetical protein